MMLSLVDAQQSRLGASQSSLCNCSAKSVWGTQAWVWVSERRLICAKRWPLVSELERVKMSRLRESNAEQNKLKGRSLFLSLSFLLSRPPALPTPPPTLLQSPSIHPFLLHPTHPACFNLWQTTMGWHQNGATGTEAAPALHGGDKQRETPLDFLLWCRSVPVQLCQCANIVHVLQG